MRRVLAVCAIAPALVLAVACATSHARPAASVQPSTVQTTSDMDGVSVGLVEYGRAFPFRHVAKGTGTLSLGPSEITWRNDEDRDRSFALRPEVIREVTMRCATRGAGTVCLELVVETVTNLEYYFRDPNWSAGQNAGIRQVYDHVRAAYPRITVREQAVDKIK